MKQIKIIIIHGNGDSTPNDHWIPYAKAELTKLGFMVLAPQFPDIPLARANYWIPFLKDTLKADENTVLIGHSTGAIAAMRFAQDHCLLGSVLISSYATDLGMESERLSGYFDRPWNWTAIKDNQQWIIQFASTNDPWIAIDEPRFVHKKLNSDYYEFNNQGHFGGDSDKVEFPELIQVLRKKLLPDQPN